MYFNLYNFYKEKHITGIFIVFYLYNNLMNMFLNNYYLINIDLQCNLYMSHY